VDPALISYFQELKMVVSAIDTCTMVRRLARQIDVAYVVSLRSELDLREPHLFMDAQPIKLQTKNMCEINILFMFVNELFAASCRSTAMHSSTGQLKPPNAKNVRTVS
jgi:hypothetical protein